jgi:hypothetical protein
VADRAVRRGRYRRYGAAVATRNENRSERCEREKSSHHSSANG